MEVKAMSVKTLLWTGDGCSGELKLFSESRGRDGM
jgi:hypothetical protein